MTASASDTLWTMDEAAEKLRISRRFLQDFLREVGPVHHQAGRRKLFDETGLAAIRAAMRRKAVEACPIGLSPRKRVDRRIGACAEQSSASILTEALRLVRAGSRKNDSSSGGRKRNVLPFPPRK